MAAVILSLLPPPLSLLHLFVRVPAFGDVLGTYALIKVP